uniref:BHLH domain-containing protein n=1 Tax=Leersia perrieri TaxID=77586 RepID=A0A0D9X8E3_9ORYZ
MTRKSMVAVGKSNGRTSGGMVSLRRRRPFQLMVLRRLRELKKIVPATSRRSHGGDVDALLRRAAEYICALELKVAVLRKLSAIYGA